jgi:hypothetical protein
MGEDLRSLRKQRLVEEVKPARDLVLHRRLLEMKLARHPHEFNLVFQVGEKLGALALGPARQLEVAQQ